MTISNHRAFAYGSIHEHLRNVIDRAHEAAVTVLEDLTIVVFNRGAEELFGYRRSEVLGQPLSMLLPAEFREEHDARVREFIQAAHSGESRPMGIRGAVRGLHRDGTEFRASASIYASREKGTGCGTAILVNTDVHRHSVDTLERLLSENQMLARQLVESEEMERRRLARDLHDDVAQWATALKMKFSLLRRSLGSQPATALKQLDEIEWDVARAQRLIENQVRRVRPTALDQVGLHGAIEDVVGRLGLREHGMSVSLAVDEAVDEVDDTTRTTAYRICREALTNVARHSEAERVWVKCSRAEPEAPNGIHLTVEDDGRGPEQGKLERGFGLGNMKRRAHALGGSIEVGHGSAGGFRLEALLPGADKQEP